MYSETSCNSGQRNDDCMHACSSGELRCTDDYMVTIRFIRWGLQARLTLTVNCNLRSCLFITRAFKSRSLRTSLMMEIGSHNLFSDMSFSDPNIQVSQNRVKSAFKALKTYDLLSKYSTW